MSVAIDGFQNIKWPLNIISSTKKVKTEKRPSLKKNTMKKQK